MLEAQASFITTEDNVAHQGDIIVVALPGHPWGAQDRKRFLVVQWDDAALEQQLRERVKLGEQWPVIALPYAVRPVEAITERCVLTKRIDLDSCVVPKSDILDPAIEVQILEPQSYRLQVAVAVEEPGIISRTLSAITSPFVAAWDWIVS